MSGWAMGGWAMGGWAMGGWASGGWASAGALLLGAALVVLPRRAARTRRRLHRQRGGVPVPDRPSDRASALLPVLCGLAVCSLAAVLVGGGAGVVAGVCAGVPAAFAARGWIRGPRAVAPTDPLRLAGAWDLLAACLRAGMPVATATHVVAERLPGPVGEMLGRVADLLAGGADAAEAWQPALAHPQTAPLAGAARRTARSGAALAGAVSELAVQVRAGTADLAEERAQRAGVLITGPLGLCFLPAFFCLGVLPVVIGLAEQLTRQW